MTRKLLDDCFLHDKDRLRHDEAIAILRDNVHAIAEPVQLQLAQCTSRILAENVIAPRNIPYNDNAAVDGYAFDHTAYLATNGNLPVSDRIPAGTTAPQPLADGTTARIFTGASMPQGADTVAMQEDCKIDAQGKVQIPAGLKQGANCRKAGEDVTKGETVGNPGDLLAPQDIAAIASTGTSELSVFDTLKVGLLSNGDEILRPGEAFEAGKVYDANHFLLGALVSNLPVDAIDLGICPDERDEVRERIARAAEQHDVILSTGGASRGEEDHLVDIVHELGKCQVWQLAIKPGRPMCFGTIDGTPCFILPGNPVAAYVCFQLYVRPALMVLAGARWQTPARYPIAAGFNLTSKPDRREFLRGYLQSSPDGQVQVQKYERDGSGLISGLRQATGLIEIPEHVTNVAMGEDVAFIPFSEFL